MLNLALQVPDWAAGLMLMAFLIIGVLMILVVLIQKPQGGGLSSAFGAGAGSGQTAFGAKTGDMLTWVTVGFFVAFVGGAVLLNFVARVDPSDVPAAQAAPSPTGQPTGQPTETDAGMPLPPAGEQPPLGQGETGGETGEEQPAEGEPGQPVQPGEGQPGEPIEPEAGEPETVEPGAPGGETGGGEPGGGESGGDPGDPPPDEPGPDRR